MLEQEALRELRRVKDAYRRFIRDNFEFAAKDCGACATFGACCVDAHFVNVHITKLEAAAIFQTLQNKLGEAERETVFARVAETIEKYDLSGEGDTFAQTFACPLFDKNAGCLVHGEAKPAACISHACYENKADLPPACLQDNATRKIEKLNWEVYKQECVWKPLPIVVAGEIVSRKSAK